MSNKRKSDKKAGIIGCGRIASMFDDDPKRRHIATHIGAYRYVRGTEVISVCDNDKNKLKRCLAKWGIQRGYTNYKQMLNKEEIDILSVCTPPETHYEIIKDAVKNKRLKAIYCEKPISVNLIDAGRITRLCKDNNKVLQINHQRRFDNLHQKLREVIRKRKWGGVQQANFYYTAGINNTGSHMFDLLRFFFGRADWITAVFSKNASYKQGDPNLDGIVKFKNGALVTFQACDIKKYLIFELNCFFDKGRLVLKNSGISVDFYDLKKSGTFSGYRELYKTKSPFNITYRESFIVRGVKHLVECMENNKQSISSGMDGLKALELINAAIVSATDNGKRVYISN